MKYVNHFNLLGVEARQRPSLTGAGAPTDATIGTVGEFYLDTDSGKLYRCTEVSNGRYTWITDTVDAYTKAEMDAKLNLLEQATKESIIYPVGTSTIENEDLLIEINDKSYSITTKTTYARGWLDLIGFSYGELGATSAGTPNILQTVLPSAIQEKPIFKKGQIVTFYTMAQYSIGDFACALQVFDKNGTVVAMPEPLANWGGVVNKTFVMPTDIHAITLLFNGGSKGSYAVGATMTGHLYVMGQHSVSMNIQGLTALVGKSVDVFGDSIWARDSSNYPATNPPYNTETVGTTVRSYPTLIREKYGMSVNNYAVSGDTILLQMPDILSKSFDNTDIVIISVGINDFTLNVPLGNLPTVTGQSFDDTTFIGAYCKCIEHIKTQKPETKIILCTPLHRDTKWRNGGIPDLSLKATDIYTPNAQNLKINDYRQAIIDIAELYSCIVADMYAESGINYLTMQTYTSDGIHPINSGYEYTAPIIFRAIEKTV